MLRTAILTALVVPLGRYMARVFEGERTLLTPVQRPVEIALYRIAGVDEKHEQHWIAYTVAMLFFNAVGFVLLFAILLLQAVAEIIKCILALTTSYVREFAYEKPLQ